MPLSPGKLPSNFMNSLLKKYTIASQQQNQSPLNYSSPSRVVLGPHVGQDTAIIDMGDRYLITKSDPVTFATDKIGYYAVNINANDIVTSGAIPKWFQSVILLPENSATEEMCEQIFRDLYEECQKIGVEIIGGHTEVTLGLERPIVIGSMIGEVGKNKLVTTFGGKPGDAILLTKGLVLEGSSLIAREKENELLRAGFTPDFVDRAKELLFNPGISVVKEALFIHQNFEVHAMHDPTEGGLAMGLVELASNSQCGFLIQKENIPFLPGSLELCNHFGLDPLSTIASGALLIIVPEDQVQQIILDMAHEGVVVAKIGNLTFNPNEYLVESEDGKIQSLSYSAIDEITKIFK